MRMDRVITTGLLAVAALAVMAAGAPARADRDGHRGWHHGHRGWGPGVVYAPPPVYYAPPPRVYYAPPPVYYAPPPVVYAPPAYVAPGVSIGLGFNFR
ncbi:hypothetical protein [Limobrevibacterium gyesilva]|uniref:Uncharacterized protein n=1 Tax=Limobrevibacterium gyesilva TaxID=2991712 RepID=A0AA41YSP1_9PROT|nr:hypothetical protein [Limobrevibacterium gyesilva]MCW3477613.1 hypothetical protein [Limobrevibacterium gyesilva]